MRLINSAAKWGLKVNIEFAGRDEQQSGQRFLDSSAPRLKRHVVSCETAGGDDAPVVRDTYPLPAGKEEKLSREFEGGALISAEGAVSSLLVARAGSSTVGRGRQSNVIEMGSKEYEALCASPALKTYAEFGVVGASAGSCSQKAQSRDLYGAAAGSANIPSLGGVCFPYAGLDEKLSHGSEQSSDTIADVIGAGTFDSGAGAGFPSLDSLENNRHKRGPECFERPRGRGKFCGRWSIQGIDPKTNRKIFRRVNCGSWGCSYCGPRKALTARASIRAVAESLGLRYFLTLTMDPSKLENIEMAVPHLRHCFNIFREYLKRKYGVAPSYVCVMEFTKAGVPHLHICFDRYIEQKWISRVWDSLGGGRIVFIKQVTVRNVARYLSKYLTKELFLSAPKGTRRITSARSINWTVLSSLNLSCSDLL
jgi:hypothetical protein